jgi:hypothetical protein
VYNLHNNDVIYFPTIVQLLSDEYGAMSPGSLEAQGLISAAEYQKVAALTQSASPDAHKKIVGKSFFIYVNY